MLRSIHMGCNDASLLNPDTVDIVFEPKACWKKRWQAKSVVVPCNSAVHAPVLIRESRTKVLKNVEIVQVLGTNLFVVSKKHIDEINRIDIVRSRAESLSHFHDGIFVHNAPFQPHRIFFCKPLGSVCLQLHRGVDQYFATFIVLWNLAAFLPKYIEECRHNVERFARVSILADAMKSSPADFIRFQGFGAV